MQEPAAHNKRREELAQILKDSLMDTYKPSTIVELLHESSLAKIELLMKKRCLNISEFLRVFKSQIVVPEGHDLYLVYGLFKLFQELCKTYNKTEITFSEISNLFTEKSPNFDKEDSIKEKILPPGALIHSDLKKLIVSPEVIGKETTENPRLTKHPMLMDKIQHLNRRVWQTQYSKKFRIYFAIDFPSTQIRMFDKNLQFLRYLEQQRHTASKDSVISYIAWSEHEERLGCILGDGSISFWAKQDSFKYEVNVPLPPQYLSSPYLSLRYSESSNRWYALDNRPTIYLLSNHNFEPEFLIRNPKMVKQKQTEDVKVIEISYRKLICVGFERNLFLISLETRQIITSLSYFKTAITSLCFNETFQALFVSTFDNYFQTYELSEHSDLLLRGKFQGLKGTVAFLATIENSPVVISLEDSATMRFWDTRDLTCYFSFKVLQNINYMQMFTVQEGLCLIGSKIFIYNWIKEDVYEERETTLFVMEILKNILIVTNKALKLYEHSSGRAVKVIKGIFQENITTVYFEEKLKILFIANDEGDIKIYEIEHFREINSLKLSPRPSFFHYDDQHYLFSIGCQGEITTSIFKSQVDWELKRTITHQTEFLRQTYISVDHDFIVVRYENDLHLYFYSYDKGKSLGFLYLPDFRDIIFLPAKIGILILLEKSLLVFVYQKNSTSIGFFLKKMVDLWQLTTHQPQAKFVQNDKLQSSKMLLFQNTLVISSNLASIFCILPLELSDLKIPGFPQSSAPRNPFRVNHQYFSEIVRQKPSLIIDETPQNDSSSMIYHQNLKVKKDTHFVALDTLGDFFVISDEVNDSVFYDLKGKSEGMLNSDSTLPKEWSLVNYTAKDEQEVEFVLKFIENEAKQTESKFFSLTQFNQKKSIFGKKDLLTLIISKKEELNNFELSRSKSLREKKMLLLKQRDEREKIQNYIELKKQAQKKGKTAFDRDDNNFKKDAMKFFNVNRNAEVMNKGIVQVDYPAVNNFENRLNSVLGENSKRSTRTSFAKMPIAKPTPKPLEFKDEDSQLGLRLVGKYFLDNFRFVKVDQSVQKNLTKRMNENLLRSKYESRKRSGSLPSLNSTLSTLT